MKIESETTQKAHQMNDTAAAVVAVEDADLIKFYHKIENPITIVSQTDSHTIQISCDSFPYLLIFYCSNFSFITKSFIDVDQDKFTFCLELLDLDKIQYYQADVNEHSMIGFLILNHFLAQKKFYLGYSGKKQQHYIKMVLNEKLPEAFSYQFYFKRETRQDPQSELITAYQLLMQQQQFKNVHKLLLSVEPSGYGYSHSFWTSEEGKPKDFWQHQCSKIMIKTPKNYVILKLPIKSSLYDLFQSNNQYILEYIEGAQNSVELILGSQFLGSEYLKIIEPAWRVNAIRKYYNDQKIRLGTFFEYSWHSHLDDGYGYGEDLLNNQISAEIAGLGIYSARWSPCNNGQKSCGIYQPYDSRYTDEHRSYPQFVRDFEFGQTNSRCQIFALD